MESMSFEYTDISIPFGNYTLSLVHSGHAEPRKPWKVLPHFHTIYELHIISRGVGTLIVNSTEYSLSSGDVYLTGPNITHSQYSPIENSMDEFCLRFDLNSVKALNSSEHDLIRLSEAVVKNPFYMCKDTFCAKETVCTILIESKQKKDGWKKRISSLSADLLVQFGRIILDDECQTPHTEGAGLSDIDIKARLDSYFFLYNAPKKIDEIIQELHISRRHFSRLMQKHYGMSYVEKINQLRISYAQQLLVNTDMSIHEIVMACGYTSQQNFIQIFKKIVSLTPGQYRKLHKQQ